MRMSTPESRATSMPQTVDDQGAAPGAATVKAVIDDLETAATSITDSLSPAAAAPQLMPAPAPGYSQPVQPSQQPAQPPPITERGPLASRRDYRGRNDAGYSIPATPSTKD